jgi:sodium-dependent phosphate transporter
MFVIGGFGLVAGLSTYGYNIMRALGVKMTKLTNARGYCAEITAAIIVIVASRYGFPVSTTQVITGAIAGIGISEVISAKVAKKPTPGKAFNWLILLKFFAGWVATLIVAGFTAAAFTAQGIYAPSFHGSNYRAQFNQAFNQTNAGIARTLAAPAFNATDATPAQRLAFERGTVSSRGNCMAAHRPPGGAAWALRMRACGAARRSALTPGAALRHPPAGADAGHCGGDPVQQ